MKNRRIDAAVVNFVDIAFSNPSPGPLAISMASIQSIREGSLDAETDINANVSHPPESALPIDVGPASRINRCSSGEKERHAKDRQDSADAGAQGNTLAKHDEGNWDQENRSGAGQC